MLTICTNQHNPIFEILYCWWKQLDTISIKLVIMQDVMAKPIDLFYDWLNWFVKLASEAEEVN